MDKRILGLNNCILRSKKRVLGGNCLLLRGDDRVVRIRTGRTVVVDGRVVGVRLEEWERREVIEEGIEFFAFAGAGGRVGDCGHRESAGRRNVMKNVIVMEDRLIGL
jgi:hypothetical protein